MSSIMTNASALTALQSLNTTNKNLEATQARISTGYRVADASDNAAYWSIATTMRPTTRRSRPFRTRSASAPPRSTPPTPA